MQIKSDRATKFTICDPFYFHQHLFEIKLNSKNLKINYIQGDQYGWGGF